MPNRWTSSTCPSTADPPLQLCGWVLAHKFHRDFPTKPKPLAILSSWIYWQSPARPCSTHCTWWGLMVSKCWFIQGDVVQCCQCLPRWSLYPSRRSQKRTTPWKLKTVWQNNQSRQFPQQHHRNLLQPAGVRRDPLSAHLKLLHFQAPCVPRVIQRVVRCHAVWQSWWMLNEPLPLAG